jgi:hypothetical integral membrane protein (TIGR02206 family)
VPLFGPLHLALMAAIAVCATLAAMVSRHRPTRVRAFRITLGWFLIVNELVWYGFRYWHEGVHLRNLPLQLCDVTLWASAIACLVPRPLLVEFAYFTGLAGAGMAVLTPDLWTPWPSYPALYFFAAHGGILVAVAILVFGRNLRLPARAVWRSFALLVAYAAAAGTVNAVTGANYMYLCRKPANASILDAFGPWPIYLIPAAAAALALFWGLWFAVRD